MSTHAWVPPEARPSGFAGKGQVLPKRPWGSDWRLSVLRFWSLCFLLPLRLPKRFMSSVGDR